MRLFYNENLEARRSHPAWKPSHPPDNIKGKMKHLKGATVLTSLPLQTPSVFFKVSPLKTCQYDSFRQKVKYNCSITFRNFMVIGLFYTIRNNLESLSPLFNKDLLQHEIERLRSVSLPYLPSVFRLLLHKGDGSISSILRLLLHGADGSNVV